MRSPSAPPRGLAKDRISLLRDSPEHRFRDERSCDMVEEPNGKFGWILDPEGNKIELWEPVDSDVDPYLES